MQNFKKQSFGSGLAISSNRLFMVALAGLMTIPFGCGDAAGGKFKAATRAVASGAVSLDGKPVALGAVVFTHKQSGMPSICPIENGNFKSPADKGPQIGVNTVTVSAKGEDGKMIWSTTNSDDIAIDDTKFAKDFALTGKQVKMAAAAPSKANKRSSSDKVWPGDE